MQHFSNVPRKPRNFRPDGTPTQQFNDLLSHVSDLSEVLTQVYKHCVHWTKPGEWDHDIQEALFFTQELARILKLMQEEKEFASIWKKNKDTILKN